jgi:hypothetical protein
MPWSAGEVQAGPWLSYEAMATTFGPQNSSETAGICVAPMLRCDGQDRFGLSYANPAD